MFDDRTNGRSVRATGYFPLFPCPSTKTQGLHMQAHSAGWGTALNRLIRQRDAGLCRSPSKTTNYRKGFLERRDSSRDLLGEFLAVKEASTRRLLQLVSNQFPCNVTSFPKQTGTHSPVPAVYH